MRFSAGHSIVSILPSSASHTAAILLPTVI